MHRTLGRLHDTPRDKAGANTSYENALLAAAAASAVHNTERRVHPCRSCSSAAPTASARRTSRERSRNRVRPRVPPDPRRVRYSCSCTWCGTTCRSGGECFVPNPDRDRVVHGLIALGSRAGGLSGQGDGERQRQNESASDRHVKGRPVSCATATRRSVAPGPTLRSYAPKYWTFPNP